MNAIHERKSLLGMPLYPALLEKGDINKLESLRWHTETLMGEYTGLMARFGEGENVTFAGTKAEIMQGLFGQPDWPNKDAPIRASHYNDIQTVLNALLWRRVNLEFFRSGTHAVYSAGQETKDAAQDEVDSLTNWNILVAGTRAGISANYQYTGGYYHVGYSEGACHRGTQHIAKFSCPSEGITAAYVKAQVCEYHEDAVQGRVAPQTNSEFKFYGDDTALTEFDEADFNSYGTQVGSYTPSGMIDDEGAANWRYIEMDSVAPFTPGQYNYLRAKGKTALNRELTGLDWGADDWLHAVQTVNMGAILLAVDFAYR